MNTVTILTIIVFFVPLAIASIIDSPFFYILSLIAIIGVPIFVRKSMKNNDKYNPKKLQDDCNKEFADLDRQTTRDLGEADNHIVALNTKIQQNYRIANS